MERVSFLISQRVRVVGWKPGCIGDEKVHPGAINCISSDKKEWNREFLPASYALWYKGHFIYV